MNILRTLFELFVLYMLYKFIFDFIIPIYQTTKQVKQKVNEMQRNVDEQAKRQSNQYTSAAKEPSARAKNEDYIDFEEVK